MSTGQTVPRQGARTPSRREKEVARLIAEGLTDALIASRLTLSLRTVHSHVRNAMNATGTASRTQLAILALREELTPMHPDEDL